jgi:poly(3-hydroxybutyrate) depolymerase
MKPPFIAPLLKIAGRLLLIGLALAPVSTLAATAAALPSYQVDEKQTSVSGLSSGAFMATQFHVAYSSTLVGAGIVAGGPYYCAGLYPYIPSVVTASTMCMNPAPGTAPDASALVAEAKEFAQSGLIDSLSNLHRQKVYLFSGTADTTVYTSVVDQTAAFYKLAGVPADNIAYTSNVDAGHAIITGNSNDTACAITAAPYINDCHFTQSQQILRQIYGNLKPPVSTLSGKIIKFNQDEFISGWLSSMSDDAYAYVPKSCETETCKVHVAFHGCEQGAAKIGNLFYTTTGYNELADANNIIVLYPQVQASNGFFSPYNPKGCWDFWGYSSFNPFAPNYFTKQGTQMTAVKAMLDRLAQPRR